MAIAEQILEPSDFTATRSVSLPLDVFTMIQKIMEANNMNFSEAVKYLIMKGWADLNERKEGNDRGR